MGTSLFNSWEVPFGKKINFKQMKRIVLAILILSTSLCVQAKKYKLALNLEQGKEYHQSSVADMTISQNFNGMDMDVEMTVKGNLSFKVIELKDDHYNMDVFYENIAMEMETPQGKTAFSSENAKPEDMMSTMLSKLTDKPFQVKMTKSGKVIEINNMDNLFIGMFDGMELNVQQKNQLIAQLKQSYGEKAFRGSFEQVTAIYPEEEVAIGDKWNTETNLEAGMSVKLKNNFTFKAENDTHYLIQGVGTLINNENSPYVKNNGMDIKIDLNGSLISEIKVDKESGWIIEATITQDLSGNTHMKGNPQMPEGMSIPMSIKSKSVITN